jgi:hypothetical protein
MVVRLLHHRLSHHQPHCSSALLQTAFLLLVAMYEPGSGHCPINEAKFYLWFGIINVFGDICILAVPIPALLKL